MKHSRVLRIGLRNLTAIEEEKALARLDEGDTILPGLFQMVAGEVEKHARSVPAHGGEPPKIFDFAYLRFNDDDGEDGKGQSGQRDTVSQDFLAFL